MIRHIKAWWKKQNMPSVGKIELTRKRQNIADCLEGKSLQERHDYLEELPPNLYESWMLDPFPSAEEQRIIDGGYLDRKHRVPMGGLG